MRPIPETVEAVAELGRVTGGSDLLEDLLATAEAVQQLVPDCVGLSLAWVEHGVTFTLVASPEQIAVLDALQLLSGGHRVGVAQPGPATEGLLRGPEEEQWWGLSVRADATATVRCSLTFPLAENDAVVGSVSLYGASDHAFEDVHPELARVLGSEAPWATRNADLAFESRRTAQEAPAVLQAWLHDRPGGHP